MALVTGTTGNDTKTFNPGDDYSLSGGTDTLVFNQTDADLSSTALTSVEVLKAGLSDATTFTVDPADMASGGSVVGSSGADTLIVTGDTFDITSTTLTSVEILQAGSSNGTTFKIDQADLLSGGSVLGDAGDDTISIKGTALNLSSTTLTGVEILKAGSASATTFTVNQSDLASGGTVAGSTGVDTLVSADAALDLTSTALTSIEKLQSLAGGTAWIVDAADLATGGSVVGSTSTTGLDSLTVNDTAINLTSTTLTSVETIAAGSASATTFTVDQADLAANGSVVGTGNDDILIVKGTAFNLLSTTLNSVEILQGSSSLATTFSVDAADLASGGSVVGSTGIDTLILKGSAPDLTSTTLTSIEKLQAGQATNTNFIVDAADLASGGSVIGSSGSDTLTIADTAFDLTSTTLTSVEKLAAGLTDATTFTVNQADLASGGSVIGSGQDDTLIIKGTTSFDLSSTSLNSVEILQADTTSATTFTVDQGDLAANGSVIGTGQNDTLAGKGSALDLSNTTLSSIEILKAATTTPITITVNQSDLASGGSVTGNSGSDTLASADATLDLTSTTLTSIEKLQAAAGGTAFTVDAADLVSGGAVTGSAGSDSLTILGVNFNLSSTTTTGIETLQAGSSLATTFTVDQADLASGGSIVGSTGTDTLTTKGVSLNLANTKLDSIEILKAGSASATTFTVDQDDLTSLGSIQGSTGVDTLVSADAALDLTSTTLTSIEKLQAATGGTTFTVDAADLASGGSVAGGAGSDGLIIAGTSFDLTSSSVTSVELLQAGSSLDTTFTVDQADLATGGSVTGDAGSDTLIVKGTSFNLLSTTLNSVETLKAGSSLATTFSLDAADLASGGSVIGGAGIDTLILKGSAPDLTSTTLSSIEKLQASLATNTNFIVDAADLVSGGSVIGSGGSDTLTVVDAAIDLTSTTLTSIEKIAAGNSNATTFTVDQADLASGGSVIGNAGNDTLIIKGTTSFDLSSTGLTSVEILKASGSLATTFTVDQGDLAAGGTVIGTGQNDTLAGKGSALDLSNTTLSSIEILKAATTTPITITVNQSDLASGGSVTGNSGSDTLASADATLDLTSTTLTSIEKLQAAAGGTDFIVDAADLASGGSVLGGAGADSLKILGTNFDLSNTALGTAAGTTIEVLKAGSSLATTFTVDQADLASGGGIIGGAGTDILTTKGTSLNLASTSLTSIEILKAGSATATTFTVDQADLNSLGAIQGSTGADTLVSADAALDLTSTSLTSIEKLQAAAGGTTFTVDAADLASGGSVTGGAGVDTLIIKGTTFDLTSSTVTGVEKLQAGSSLATTFSVDQADLFNGGSIIGGAGVDTLVSKTTAFNLSSTTLTSVETLKAGTSLATTFTLDGDDLGKLTSVIGSSGIDTLAAGSTSIDLTSTTLTSIEVLKAGLAGATTFTVDQADLASGGSVVGSTGQDTLAAGGATLDLTSTTLTSIEKIAAGTTNGTTFTVDAADLLAGGSVIGNAGNDTLIIKGTSFDVSSTSLTSIEVLQASTTLATTFTVDNADLAAGGSIVGTGQTDTLTTKGVSLDLSSTNLTSIEILKAGSASATTFTVDQSDLNSLSTIQGGAGADTLVAGGATLDLTSTTLSSIEKLQAAVGGTTFTVDAADLVTGGSVTGGAGADVLIIKGATFDLTSSTVTGVETLQAGSSLGTTFTVDLADLAAGGTVKGDVGNDTLIIKGTSFNLLGTTLNSIETLKAGSSLATTFSLDNADLTSVGSIVGSSGLDTLLAGSSTLDLTSTSLTSIEILKAAVGGTAFTLDQADLASGGSVLGSSGQDALIINGTAFDLSSSSVTSVEILKAATSNATTFTVDLADLASGGSVIGSTGIDTLIVNGTAFNLSSTALTSVEILQAGSSLATTFTLDNNDLSAGGSVIGGAGLDILLAGSTDLNLSNTTLTSIDILKATRSTGTNFTLDQNDLATGGSVLGSTGTDSITAAGTALDLTSTTLTSIEVLQAGTSFDTTFTVDQADLASGGSVIGSTGSDTLIIQGTSFNAASTTLTSIEKLQAGGTLATTFSLSQNDLASGGSIIGTGQTDTLVAAGAALDLTSTNLTSIEILKAGLSLATTFTVDQADLASGGSVIGSSGVNSLVAGGTALDLTSTSLTSIEKLQAGTSLDTTFTVDTADLASGGSVIGSSGNDSLISGSTAIDLSSSTLTSIEKLQAGSSLATTFTLDQADLASGGSILGSSGTDTLIIKGTALDLTSTTLSNIEVLQAGSSLATTFTVDAADLVSGGSVVGSSGNDTLIVADATINLTSTTLTSIEKLQAGSSLATTFTVDAADLASGGSVVGSSGTDTLIIKGTAFDLSSSSVTGVEILKAATSNATTFTVDLADLASGGSVVGSSGVDTLIVNGTAFNLSSTALTSVEILQAGSSLATTFTLDNNDLATGGSVIGGAGLDVLLAGSTDLNLSNTTLTSIDILKATQSTGTNFTLNQDDLAFGGSVLGSTSGIDTITTADTQLDLTGTTLTSIEVLQAGSSNATTFSVDAADLASGGSVIGSTGNDTLVIQGTAFNLASTSLTSIEKLQASGTQATTFTLNQNDLAAGGSVIGNISSDTLVAAGTALDLTSTTLTSIEKLQAGLSLATTFTVDQADLASGGSVVGSSGVNSLVAGGTTLDLTSTTLTSIEKLQAGSSLATTFTLDTADLASGGSVIGSSGNDTLVSGATSIDLTSSTLTSVEIIKAGSNSATTFTLDQADLASGGSVIGSNGTDTLIVKDAAIDLTSTALTSIEILQAGNSLATTFTVDTADLASGGSVVGSSGSDTLVVANTAIDLTSTTLTSIERLQAGLAGATTFTVDAADLVSGGSVLGSTGNDTLVIKGTAFDLTSTSLSSVEILKAATSNATTFSVDAADLASGGTVQGSSGSDTLIGKATAIDLSSTTLTSIEKLQAGSSLATTFTVDTADLVSGGSVVGSSGTDTLIIKGTAADLTSTTLSSIEILSAGASTDTTFTVDAADLVSGGTVIGSSGNDTLVIAGTSFDLTSTTLSLVEILKAGSSNATTFTLDQADLISGGSVVGSSGTDTLTVIGTAVNLASTTLTSIEKLQASGSVGTTFTVDQADLAPGGSVVGSTGTDTLIAAGTALDLTSTTLTSVEIIQAGSSLDSTFTVDQADLASGGSVIGSSGTDTLAAGGTALNLTSTTLSSIEVLKAGTSNATTFTVDTADLALGGSVVGSSGNDTLSAGTTSIDLTSTTLTSIEILKAGSSLGTTFTIDQADLASGGSVVGNSGTDILLIKGSSLDLSSTTLTSVEVLQAGTGVATTFLVDQADLASGGSVVGSNGVDTLVAVGTAIDLSTTSLTSIEVLKAGNVAATTFTVDAADLLAGGSVVGSTGNDTLIINGTAFDLTSTTLTSVEILKAGSSLSTTFTVDAADLASGGSVVGSSGTDTLVGKTTAIDLSSTTLTSVENLKAGTSLGTTFTVDAADLASNGSVTGSSGVDTLIINGTSADLTSTTLSSIEILQTGSSLATTFTVNPADLASGGSVIGSSGNDILVVASTAFDLSSTSLTSIEILKAGLSTATTFTVDQADLASGGSVIGSSGNDSLAAKGTALDLSSTTLTSVETLKAGSSLATTFIVNQADLASGGSVQGSSGNDTLTSADAALDLSSTTLSSVEILQAGLSVATTFTVDAADLASGGSVIGSSGNDTLLVKSTAVDLSSTALSSIEILKAASSLATSFTVDQADLVSGGSVVGSSGSDSLVAAGTSLDLSSTALTSIEILKAGNSNATTFVVDQADLSNGGSVQGSSGNDTLTVNGTSLDFSSTALTSIEILKAGSSLATTFTVDQADLANTGTVQGNAGNDTLVAFGTQLDLTSTTLTSIEILKAGNVAATTFTVDQADLASGGSVIGSTGSDTLAAGGTAVDLSSTTLTSIEKLTAALSIATTFTVDQADLSNGGSVNGSTGNDTLAAAGTGLNLTSTTLSSIEILKAGTNLATTFTVDAADLASGGTVTGGTANDTLIITSTAYNLTSTTLISVEALQAGLSTATTFTLDQADLIGGGSVIGSSGSDTIVAQGTVLDLSNTSIVSVETLKAGSSLATTFTVDQADLVSNGSVTGSTGNDTLAASGTTLDLTSTTLTSIEILKAANTNATTFTVDQADLSNGGSVTGSTGNDTLAVGGTSLDLTSTTLTSIEILKAANASATTFTVDAADLASGGSVIGSSGNDTLSIKSTAFDLSSTTLSSVEILKANLSLATTFTVDQADLASGGSVIGSSGSDTIAAFGTTLDLSSTSLSSIEVLKAGTSNATVFTVDQGDLASAGSVTGSTGNDILIAAGTQLDLSSTTLTSIEVLQAGSTLATTFTVDAADLASGGSVNGNTGNDILIMKTTAFNLSSTTLTSVEILTAGTSGATTFTVDQADLASGGTVNGSTGSDILLANGTTLDLSSTVLTSIETLKAGNAAATTFTVDQADLASAGSVTGSTGNDTLVAFGTQLDLTSTTLTSIEILKAGNSLATTFTVDAADLASGGTVTGSTGNDILAMKTTAFDLTSTTLTSIEILSAGTAGATTFTVDQADLASGGTVNGSTGSDILLVKGTAADLTSTTLTSIENLKAQSSLATTFTVDQADLIASGSVTGSSGNDTLAINGTSLDLSSTTLSSVEILKANLSTATTFVVDQADLISAGTVTGSTGNDTLTIFSGTSLDLTSTTLTSVEILKSVSTQAMTFTVDAADLLSGGSVVGTAGNNDTLLVKGTAADLTSTTLSSVEVLKAQSSLATTFTVDQADLISGGSVTGSSGNDTLVINGTSLDLSSTSTTSVEILKAGLSTATTFIVDTADLASGGSVTGSTGNDTLAAGSTSIDLTSTTLTSIEILQAGTSLATTFTVDAADLASGGSVNGSTGIDTLAMKTTAFDLTSTTLTSIERLTAGVTLATTFTVNQADLASGGTVTGTTQTDILTISGSSLDLSSTTLVSIENLKAGLSTATTFIVDQADLVASGTVTGSSGNDTLTIKDVSLDLTSTTLSSVETIKAGLSLATTFTVDAADLLSGGSVTGSSGTDILVMKTSAFDLTSTTLTSVEVLQAGVSTATTFTIDLADLAAAGTVIGSSGVDSLVIKNASYDLTSTTLSSVEILQAGLSLATTFTLDQADLANAGTVAGSTGTDTLQVAGSSLDLTSTTLTSIEAIRAGTGVATTFTVDAADLASGGSVFGSSGTDTLIIKGTSFDLTSTTISNVEILQAGSSLATTFTVDTTDLLTGGTVSGSSGNDTLTILGTSFDLTSTTVSSVEILKAASSLATTFTVDQLDLLSGGSVVGSSGTDTLIVNGTTFDLSGTSLTSIEVLQGGVASATNFILDQADLASGGTVIGNAGIDTLSAFGTSINLTSTTLSSIEILNAASSLSTTFTVDQSDLISGGSVTGNISSDTLAIAGTSLNLTSTTLTSIEILKAGLSTATTFTVDQSDLLSNGAVVGSSGVDTLITSGTALDLSSTALSSVEVLKAGTNLATTFTVDQVDLVAGGSVVGSSGSDTLTVNGHNIDLSNTTLTSIETINTSAPSSSSTFTVGSGIGGATIELTTNSVTDTVILATGYKVADTTSDATILAHSVTLSHFADGVGGDVIDLSAVTNGAPTSSVDITGYIALSAPATLKEALDLAAAGNGSSTATVVTFQYAGDTYVLADNSASHTLTTDDVVVKLTGTHTLSDASNITF